MGIHPLVSPFARPRFDAGGRVVARRELTMGERVYLPGEELDAGLLAPRQIAMLWQQGVVDTMPREPPPAPPPAPPPPKSAAAKQQPNPLLAPRR